MILKTLFVNCHCLLRFGYYFFAEGEGVEDFDKRTIGEDLLGKLESGD